MRRFALAILSLAFAVLATASQAADRPLAVVAAETFYGDVIRQVGGSRVDVVSVLSNAEQDPHHFEPSPSTARAVADARLVVYNGADYDPWMGKLLRASRAPARRVIVVADLVGKRAGDNPHIWYDPATMPALARAVAAALAQADPDGAAEYDRRRQIFLESLAPIDAKIAAIRGKFAGIDVTATEPIFGYMAQALGLTMRNRRFQLSIMNETEPRASDIAAFQKDLATRTVKVLFYNNQTGDDLTERLLKIARESKVPVVGVGETLPPGSTYRDWVLKQLDAVEAALAAPPP